MEDSTLSKALMIAGSAMMGRANLIGTSAFANGAATGFTTGFILSGGELDKAVQNGVISGVTAAATYEVGHGGKDNKPLFGDNFVATAIAHGVVQGVASELRGGDFRSGFVSGVVGKVAGHYAAPYISNNVIANATIIGMIGGIASEASGGEFYEGAMQAAFVYLFNDMFKDPRLKNMPASMGGEVNKKFKTPTSSVSGGIGGGAEVSCNMKFSENTDIWTLGVGADFAATIEGVSASLAANSSSIAVTGSYKLPMS